MMFVKGTLTKLLISVFPEFVPDGEDVVATIPHATFLIPGHRYAAEVDGRYFELCAKKVNNDDVCLVSEAWEIRDCYASNDIKVTLYGYNWQEPSGLHVNIWSINHNAPKINPDLLPSGLPSVEEGNLFLVAEQAVDTFDGFCLLDGYGGLFEGNEYTVMLNGVEYNLIAKYGAEWGCVYLGNPALVDDGEDDGTPFAIDAYPNGGEIYLDVYEDGKYTVSVYGYGEIIKKLDERCLPDGIGGIGGGAKTYLLYFENNNMCEATFVTEGLYQALVDFHDQRVPLNLVVMMSNGYCYVDQIFDETEFFRITFVSNHSANICRVYPDGTATKTASPLRGWCF